MFAAKSNESLKTKSEKPSAQVNTKGGTAERVQINPLWQQLATRVQAKLTVGTPDDPYEREADRVADQVMRMPEPVVQRACPACAAGEPPCPKCEDEEETAAIHRNVDGSGDNASASVPEGFLSSLGPGRPLDPATRAFMEPRFGQGFENVRIYADGQAGESARAVNALAFTVGQNVVFREGQYAPATSEGRRLLAHELTHVVQQRTGLHRTSAGPANLASNQHGQRLGFTPSNLRIQRQGNPVPDETRWRIELCVKPFYYDDKGKYNWSLEPEPNCSDMTIPSDRERAWKCLNSMYWSEDGKKWDWFDSAPNCSGVKLPVPLADFRVAHRKSGGRRPRLKPGSSNERKRIELCVNPFYYDDKGKYRWGVEPEPDCSDMTIPSDRERAWKCLSSIYWSRDGKKWTWPFDPEPKCSDLKLPMPLETFRGETPEAKKAREESERRAAIVEKNRERIDKIRTDSPTDVEALARTFTDGKITDDGTIAGRVNAILAATQHTFIPGLQTGIEFGQTGFRKEFLDPWPSSENQVGHFLTAVRLGFDPGFASNLLFLAILDAWWDDEIPLRLIIGHEKEPDPDIFDVFSGFKKQYKSTTEEDIKNFKAGNLDKIKVGTGKGNSMADLLLSHKGWLLGRWIAKGQFNAKSEIADWIRSTLGKSTK